MKAALAIWTKKSRPENRPAPINPITMKTSYIKCGGFALYCFWFIDRFAAINYDVKVRSLFSPVTLLGSSCNLLGSLRFPIVFADQTKMRVLKRVFIFKAVPQHTVE